MGQNAVKQTNGAPTSSSMNVNGNPGQKSFHTRSLSNEIIFTEDDKKITKDDFELLKLIGKGNFAKVMQVRQKDTGKIYAMKILNKQKLRQSDQVEHTKTERIVLQHVEHPFLVKMVYAFQTPEKLYMIMDFVNGGELFFHLKREQRFSESRAKFYAAELLMALEHLHSHDVVYRDLKPENILMDKDGHVMLTDFGLSKVLKNRDRTHTFCGTPEYLAPEVLLNAGHSKPVDWWSFGTLIYEMMIGIPPFYSENIQEMYDMILNSDLYIPENIISVEGADLLMRLLERDPLRRLGTKGPEEVKSHPWFAGIDWTALYKKQIPPPFVPTVKDESDIGNFDEEFTNQRPIDSPPTSSPVMLGESVQREFEGFSYVSNHMERARPQS